MTRFWSLLGSPGASLGDPGGSYFRPWTLPGRPQGARGANFKPSWANPFLDLDFGPQKITKNAQFRKCPNLENCTLASTGAQFSHFHQFPTRTLKSSILGALLGAFWLLFGLPGPSWSSRWAPLGVLWRLISTLKPHIFSISFPKPFSTRF